MDLPLQWLLDGPAWVRYRTRLDLLGVGLDDAKVQSDRQAMLSDEAILALMTQVTTWPWPALTRHNDAKHPLHALAFLAALGLNIKDGALTDLVAKLMADASSEGPLQVTVQIPTHFGGSGEIEPGWMLCDAPLITATLLQLGARDARLGGGVCYLTDLVRENGWPCAATARLGRFRGPGRKDDPCPYANLLMLQLLSRIPELRDGKAAKTGAEALLSLWTQRREQRPYLFAMGQTFSQPKAPLIWYDLLHLLDVLTQFDWLHHDPRLIEMAKILSDQADDQGRYKAGSVWMAWKGWEFAQKREPSRWITLLAHRALARIG